MRSNRRFRAILEPFASTGLVQNEFISGIWRTDHLTPGYILGQKKRLEAEHRYSTGLLPKVIQCNDFLLEKHITCDSAPPLSRGAGGDSLSPLSRGAATESVA